MIDHETNQTVVGNYRKKFKLRDRRLGAKQATRRLILSDEFNEFIKSRTIHYSRGEEDGGCDVSRIYCNITAFGEA